MFLHVFYLDGCYAFVFVLVCSIGAREAPMLSQDLFDDLLSFLMLPLLQSNTIPPSARGPSSRISSAYFFVCEHYRPSSSVAHARLECSLPSLLPNHTWIIPLSQWYQSLRFPQASFVECNRDVIKSLSIYIV